MHIVENKLCNPPHQQKGRGGGGNETKFKGGVYQKKGIKTKNQGGRELKVTGNKAKCTCKGGGEGGLYICTRNGNEDRKSRGGLVVKKSQGGHHLSIFFLISLSYSKLYIHTYMYLVLLKIDYKRTSLPPTNPTPTKIKTKIKKDASGTYNLFHIHGVNYIVQVIFV